MGKVKETLVRKGFLPDMNQLTDMFNQKFDALIAKLDEMLAVLKEINAKTGPS
jgi:hypothetical protein